MSLGRDINDGGTLVPKRVSSPDKLRLQLFVVGLGNLVNSLNYWTVLPALPFLIRNLYVDGLDPLQVGYYSGVFSSLFTLGQIVGKPVWIRIMDRAGKRISSIAAILLTGTLTLALGFAESYISACAIRFLLGVTFGSILTSRELVADIVTSEHSSASTLDDSSHYAAARRTERNHMSLYSSKEYVADSKFWLLVSSFGRSLGPLLGGFTLCATASSSSSSSSSSSGTCSVLFSHAAERSPFLLSAVIIFALCCLIVVITYVILVLMPGHSPLSLLLHGVDGERSPGSSFASWLFSSGDYQQVQSIELDSTSLDVSGRDLPIQEDSLDRKRHGAPADSASADQLNSVPRKNVSDAVNRKENDYNAISNIDIGMDNESAVLWNSSIKRSNSFGVSSAAIYNSPDVPSNANKKKLKKRVSFNSKVLVKNIDESELSLRNLRQISEVDVPIVPPGMSAEAFSPAKKPEAFENDNELSEDSQHVLLATPNAVACAVDGSEDVENPTPQLVSIWDHSPGKKRGAQASSNGNLDSDSESLGARVLRYSNGSEFSDSDLNEALLQRYSKLLDSKNVMLCCVMHGVLAYINISAIEVIPLWFSVPRELGGIGVSAGLIGLTLAFSWLVFLFVEFFLFSYTTMRYPLVAIYRLSAVAILCSSLFISILFKLIVVTDMSPFFSWLVLTLAISVVFGGIQSCQMILNLFTKNSCYSHERRDVIAIAQTFAVVAKVAGPVMTGVLFSWCAESGASWPVNSTAVWNAIAVLSVSIILLSSCFTRKIIRTRREPSVPRYAVTMDRSSRAVQASTNTDIIPSEVDGTIEMTPKL
jgi:MFS family permease